MTILPAHMSQTGASYDWPDELFRVSAEEVKELQTQPELVLSRLGRRFAETTFTLVAFWLHGVAQEHAYNASLRETFYRQYPDLVGQEDLVGQVAEIVEAQNPELPRHLLLPLVAERARAEVGNK